jgi:hypothetical protein
MPPNVNEYYVLFNDLIKLLLLWKPEFPGE